MDSEHVDQLNFLQISLKNSDLEEVRLPYQARQEKHQTNAGRHATGRPAFMHCLIKEAFCSGLTQRRYALPASPENSHAPEEEERKILYSLYRLPELSHPFDEDVLPGTV